MHQPARFAPAVIVAEEGHLRRKGAGIVYPCKSASNSGYDCLASSKKPCAAALMSACSLCPETTGHSRIVHGKGFLLRLWSCLIRHGFRGGGSCGRSFRRHSLGRQHLHRRNFRRRLRFSGRGIGFLFSRRLRIDRAGAFCLILCYDLRRVFVSILRRCGPGSGGRCHLRRISFCRFRRCSGSAAACEEKHAQHTRHDLQFFHFVPPVFIFLFRPVLVHNTTTTGSPTSQRESAQLP